MQDENVEGEQNVATDDLKDLSAKMGFTPHLQDLARYGYFASQYYAALERFHYESEGIAADNGFWFGKMTTPRFVLKDFDGNTPRAGKDFWNDLVNGKFTFPTYTIITIAYVEGVKNTVDGYRTGTCTVTGTIDYNKDGAPMPRIAFSAVHTIRQIWAADETNF